MENRHPGPLKNWKTGTRGPNVTLAGPYKDWKTGTWGLRKTGKPGAQWNPQKS